MYVMPVGQVWLCVGVKHVSSDVCWAKGYCGGECVIDRGINAVQW